MLNGGNITTSGTLSITGNTTTVGQLRDVGNITIGHITPAAATIAGNLSNFTTFTAASITLNAPGAPSLGTIYGPGTITASAGNITTATGTLVSNTNTIQAGNALRMSGDLANVIGDLIANANGSTGASQLTNVTGVTGNISILGGSLTLAGNLSNVGGSISTPLSSITLNAGVNALNIGGNINACTTFTTTAGSNLQGIGGYITSGGAMAIGGNIANLAGNINTLSTIAVSAGANVTNVGGNITSTGAVTVGGTIANVTGSLNTLSSITVSAGANIFSVGGNITTGGAVTLTGNISNVLGSFTIATTPTITGTLANVTGILQANTSVVLTALTPGNIAGIHGGILTPTLTIGNGTSVSNIGGLGIANIAGNTTVGTAVTVDGNLSNFASMFASTLTINAAGAAIGGGNITTTGALSITSNTTSAGQLRDLGNVMIGTTATLTGTLANITGILQANTSISLTALTPGIITGINGGILTPTLTINNGTSVSDIGGLGIANIAGNTTVGTAVTVNGNLSNFASMFASTLTINAAGVMIDGGDITTSGALSITGNTTTVGQLRDVGNITIGHITPAAATIAGNLSNFTSLTAASITLNAPGAPSLGAIYGPGTISTTGGNITTATGTLIANTNTILSANALRLSGDLANVTGDLVANANGSVGSSLLTNVTGVTGNISILGGSLVVAGAVSGVEGAIAIPSATGSLTLNNGTSITGGSQITVGAALVTRPNTTLMPSGNLSIGTAVNIGQGELAVGISLPGQVIMPTNSTLRIGTATAGIIRVGEANAAISGGPVIGILDASRSSNVSINSTHVITGTPSNGGGEAYGQILLPTLAGATTNILSTSYVRIGDSTIANSAGSMANNPFGPGTYGSVLNLGNQAVNITTPSFQVSGTRSSGTVLFTPGAGSVTINNGLTATALLVAVNANTTAAMIPGTQVGMFDTRGGTINANFAAITLGNNIDPGGLSTAYGAFILDGINSNVAASSVALGGMSAAALAAGSEAYGNLTVLDGSLIVSGGLSSGIGGSVARPNLFSVQGGNVSLGACLTYGTGVTIVSVSGGNLTFNNHVVVNAGGNSTLDLSGGILNANNRNIPSLTAFNFSGGTLRNPATISQAGQFLQTGGTLQRDTGGNTTIVGNYLLNGGTAIANGNLVVQGAAGITVNSSATLQGLGRVIASSVVVNSGGTLAPGGSPGTLVVTGPSNAAPAITIAGALNISFTDLGTPSPVFTTDGSSSATAVQSLLSVTGAGTNTFNLGDATIRLYSDDIGAGGYYSWTIATLPAGTVISGVNEAGNGLLSGIPGVTTLTIDTTNFTAGGYSGSADDSNFALYHIGNTIVLSSTAPVPEPTTITLFGAVGLGFFGWARRRRAKRTA